MGKIRLRYMLVTCAGLLWACAAVAAPGGIPGPPEGVPKGGLVQCQTDLGTCETDLATCDSDLAACEAALTCGNGVVDDGEDCDLGNLGGETCDSATSGDSPYGTLACGAGCVFDTTSCVGRFEDTGVTVIDHETGLEWLKTTDDDTVTDKDNLYTWNSGSDGISADGTVFTAFLSGVNAAALGGHCNWRLPQQNFPYANELATIADCYGDSICDADLGPVNLLSDPYWTAGTLLDLPGFDLTEAVYGVDHNGGTSSLVKTHSHPARAVRVAADTRCTAP